MKIVFALTLCAMTLECLAQDSPVNIKKIEWLAGTWQGTGFLSGGNASDMGLTFDKESLKLVITSSGQTVFNEQLDPDSEYSEVQPSPSGISGIEAHFLGEMKWENRLLAIIPVSEGHMNLYIVFNRRKGSEAFIMQGSFIKN